MNPYILELDKVSVRKGKDLPLADIDLKLMQNEFMGIIGPNGAGKTTLLNVIAGFERFQGDLTLFGRPETWARSRAARLRIGYVPQMFPIDPAFPIRALEAIMTGAIGRIGLFRSPGRRETDHAMALMDMMRIPHLAQRPLGRLSGGERQKVSLARAILQEPEILLMDEPTANLDIAVQKEVLNLVDEIHREKKMTLLFVTHDFNILPGGMKRALLLANGRKVFDGSIHEALSGPILSRLFGYPLETFERNGKRFVSYG